MDYISSIKPLFKGYIVGKNSTKILIIEDHHEMVVVLTKFLSEHGFQISSSESGEDALKKIQNDKPDVILMDIMLPGISGIELMRRWVSKMECNSMDTSNILCKSYIFLRRSLFFSINV